MKLTSLRYTHLLCTILIAWLLPAFAHASCPSGNDIVLPHNLTAWDYGQWGGNSPSNPVTCNVIVPTNHDIFLNREHLYFAEGVTFTISSGARMVGFNSTFESVAYDVSWAGFRIEGDENLPPTDPAQGQMFLKNCNLINPEVGIRLGLNNATGGGGVLVAENNTFNNYAEFGIEILPYAYPNASRITGNTFRTNLIPGELFAAPGYRVGIYLIAVMNIIIQDNIFYNDHGATPPGSFERGLGIHALESTFYASGNSFYWLTFGIYDKANAASLPFSGHPLVNPTRITNNRFFNIQVAVQAQHSSQAYIDQNKILINDNNIQVLQHLPSTSSPFIRVFSGVVVYGVSTGTNIVTIANNNFETNIQTSLPGAKDLLLRGVVGANTQTNRTIHIYENNFDYKMPQPDVYPNGSIQAITTQGDAQYLVECNTFDLDGASSRNQVGIAWEGRTIQTAVGSPTRGTGNEFINFTNCGPNLHTLRGSPFVDYYELVGTGNYLSGGCALSTNVVDITGTGTANGCSFPGPPAPIPGSIQLPPALPLYPSSKAMAATAVSALSVFPNPTAPGPVTVRLPEAARQLRLYDVQGRLLQQVELSEDRTTLRLDLGDLSPGIYIIALETATRTQQQKIILY